MRSLEEVTAQSPALASRDFFIDQRRRHPHPNRLLRHEELIVDRRRRALGSFLVRKLEYSTESTAVLNSLPCVFHRFPTDPLDATSERVTDIHVGVAERLVTKAVTTSPISHAPMV